MSDAHQHQKLHPHSRTAQEDIRLWVEQDHATGRPVLKHNHNNAKSQTAATTAANTTARFPFFSSRSRDSHLGDQESDRVGGDRVNGGGEDEHDESDGEDDDKGCMLAASAAAQIAVRQVTNRSDFLLGLACLAIALWLRVSQDEAGDDGRV
jgi:hypothetical protein